MELGGEHVLVNRKKDKTLEVHENLEFHGGIGATLVMRLFAQADFVRKLRDAGFSDVVLQMEPVERFGIVFDGPSRPGLWWLANSRIPRYLSRLYRRKTKLLLGPSDRRSPHLAPIRDLPNCTKKKRRLKSAWKRSRRNCAGGGLALAWTRPQTGFGSKPGAIQMKIRNFNPITLITPNRGER